MPKIPISAVLITKNAAHELPACLASVDFCAEILVVDSGSTDATVAIAEACGARVIRSHWRGFGAQKQFAVEQAVYDWVLCIDADERVSERLRQSLLAAFAELPSATARIRSSEDPQRRGECTLPDRPAAQGLHQSALCPTALLRKGFIRAFFARLPCSASTAKRAGFCPAPSCCAGGSSVASSAPARCGSPSGTFHAYRYARCNRFMGRYLRHGEGYPDWVLRCFNRRHAHWSDDVVHEKVLVTSDAANVVGTLEGDLLHDSAESLGNYLAKQNRYSTLAADAALAHGKRARISHLVFSPLLRFIKFYFFRLGLLDGLPGLVHILIGCGASFAKYIKMLDAQRRDWPHDGGGSQ